MNAQPNPLGRQRWYDSALVGALALAALFTTAAVFQFRHLTALADKDIWWHLSTGLWILQNHAVPHTGIFSQAASLAWVDASWGFDVLAAVCYRLFGMAGVPLLLMVLQIGVAIAVFALARSASRRFWPAVLVAAVGQCCLVPLQPRPAVCSVVLLAAELALLLRARGAGNVRVLYWLPPLFLLWANLDRQFSYGLLTMALFCLAVFPEQLLGQSGTERVSSGIRPGALALVAMISFAATFATPNVWHVHAQIWQSATHTAADRYLRELHSMRFRQPQDYVLMLLAMSAFFALGRRRSRDLFLILLLVFSAAISFRMMRDNWFVVVTSVAIIGSALRQDVIDDASIRQLPRVATLASVALVLFVIVGAALGGPRNEVLLSKVSEKFPARAADYIRVNHLAQPLFNTYDWGGFLTFSLPEYPVSIDSRNDLYGDALIIPYFKLMQAEIQLESDPSFAGAQTFLLESDSQLAQALSTLPGFRVAYKDEQAIVLARE